MAYDIVLIDLDHTLLDSDASESLAFEAMLTVFDTRFERALDPEVKLKLLKL